MQPFVRTDIHRYTVRTCHLQRHLVGFINDVALIVDVVSILIYQIFSGGDFLNASEEQSDLFRCNLDAHRISLPSVIPETANNGCATLHDLRNLQLHFKGHTAVLDGVVIIRGIKHEGHDVMNGLRAIGKQHGSYSLRIGAPPVRAEIDACKRRYTAPVASCGKALAVGTTVGSQFVPVAHSLSLCHSCRCRDNHGKGSRHAADGDSQRMCAALVETLVERLHVTVCRKGLCGHSINGHDDICLQ